jgi:hypothetical protein
MRRKGVPVAVLGLLGAGAVLTGCTKPTPAVTVQSGPNTLRSEAVQYVQDGKTVGSRKGPKVLTVRPGDNVNISVDKKTADAGWVVLLGGQKLSPVLTGNQHHFAFRAPTFSGGTEAALAVFEQPPNGGNANGVWLFTLRQEV